MKIKLIALVSIVLLSGCSNTTSSYETLQKGLTDDLKDCKAYSVQSFTVIRCPNSDTTTSYKQGNVRKNVTITEDNFNTPVQNISIENKPNIEEKVILMDGKKYKITEL